MRTSTIDIETSAKRISLQTFSTNQFSDVQHNSDPVSLVLTPLLTNIPWSHDASVQKNGVFGKAARAGLLVHHVAAACSCAYFCVFVRGVYQGEGVWYIPISITLIWISLDTVHYVCVHIHQRFFLISEHQQKGGGNLWHQSCLLL